MSWIVAWGKSWPIAFPILLTVVPMARKLVNVFLDPSSRFEPIIFALFVSIMMTFVISGVSTHSAISFSKGFIASWMSAWGMSWVVTYPIQLIVLPMAQKLVSICILPPDFPNQSPHAWTPASKAFSNKRPAKPSQGFALHNFIKIRGYTCREAIIALTTFLAPSSSITGIIVGKVNCADHPII